MSDFSQRTEMLIGAEGLAKLKAAHVAVFGAGGVGGYVIEALARAGIGQLTIVDGDTISPTNLNRQIIATTDTIGANKTDAFKARIATINPDCKVNTITKYLTKETASEFDFTGFDYVVDAIDMVTAKVIIATTCQDLKIPEIASMGTGGKLTTCNFHIADIYKTSVCPLAKAMRKQLKEAGIKKLKCLYSTELPPQANVQSENGRHIPGSISYTPAIAGLMIAGEVIQDILKL